MICYRHQRLLTRAAGTKTMAKKGKGRRVSREMAAVNPPWGWAIATSAAFVPLPARLSAQSAHPGLPNLRSPKFPQQSLPPCPQAQLARHPGFSRALQTWSNRQHSQRRPW